MDERAKNKILQSEKARGNEDVLEDVEVLINTNLFDEFSEKVLGVSEKGNF